MKQITKSFFVVALFGFSACSGVPTPSTTVDYDTSSSALTTTNQTYREISIWGDPIASTEETDGGQPASGYACGQASVGTCPTKTVTCGLGGAVATMTLVYSGDGTGNDCTDSTGTKVAGTVVLTRNGFRDWTVTFTSLLRGANASADAGANANGLALNGSVGFKKSLGQSVWSITLDALTASGTKSGGSTDQNCTRNCLSRSAFTTTPSLTLTTDGGALTLDATLTGQKKMVVGGTVLMSGAVTGQIDAWFKGPAGNESVVLSRVIDAGVVNQSVTLTNVTYNLPFACTCPTSGSVATSSFLGCGVTTVTFAASTSPGTCATATATYSAAGNSAVCEFSDDLVSQSVTEACLPIQ
ncbi:MAG: hypothetical protein HYY84_03770 [Deltaproteobacteria bacterium]|nr:hypothetical protein [Deltaproteobacteria bacterium]